MNYAVVTLLGLVALAGLLAIWALRRPLGLLLRLAIRGGVGGAAVWAFDFLGKTVGLHVGVNPWTALTVGVLGFPGLGLLLAMKLWAP